MGEMEKEFTCISEWGYAICRVEECWFLRMMLKWDMSEVEG